MSATDYQPPDLASVLATLAAYAPPQPSTPQLLPPASQLQPPEPDIEEGEYDPADFTPSIAQPSVVPNSALASLTPTPGPPPPTPQAPAPRPHTTQSTSSSLESASTIISWPPALRHVMKYVVPNPGVSHRIQHLIRTQHQHERQWWSGREALLQKQKNREQGRKKLDDVLASVGGLINSLAHETSPQTDLNELNLYDRKVHRACMEMNVATTAELARLGVPFFVIDKALVVRDATLEAVGKTKIAEKDLQELKTKMLGLLEDLCGE